MTPLFSIRSRSEVEHNGRRYAGVTVSWFVDGREPGFENWRDWYTADIPPSADSRAGIEQWFTDDEAGRVYSALRRALDCSDIHVASVRPSAQVFKPYRSILPGGQIGFIDLSAFPAAAPYLSAPTPLNVRGLFNIGPRR
jgi:hypothetical protein